MKITVPVYIIDTTILIVQLPQLVMFLFCCSIVAMTNGVLSSSVKMVPQATCSPTILNSTRTCMRNTTWSRRSGVVPTLTIVSCTLPQGPSTTAGTTLPLLLVSSRYYYIADEKQIIS